jgi:hypothetical protein
MGFEGMYRVYVTNITRITVVFLILNASYITNLNKNIGLYSASGFLYRIVITVYYVF